MKIHLNELDGPYSCEVDPGVMNVTLKEVFLGVLFKSDSGEKLSVCMRDTGFEIHYTGGFGENGFDAGWFEFKNGCMNHMGSGWSLDSVARRSENESSSSIPG